MPSMQRPGDDRRGPQQDRSDEAGLGAWREDWYELIFRSEALAGTQDVAEALASAHEALELIESKGVEDLRARAETHKLLAELYESGECWMKAAEHYRRAIAALEQDADGPGETCLRTAAHLHLSNVLDQLGDWAGSIAELERALQALESVSLEEQAELIPHAIEIARTLIDANRPHSALQLLASVQPAVETSPSALRQAFYREWVSAVRESKEPSEAAELLSRALCEPFNGDSDEALILYDALAAATEDCGMPDKALKIAREAFEAALASSDDPGDPRLVQAVLRMADLLQKDFQLYRAQTLLKDSIDAVRARLEPEVDELFEAAEDEEGVCASDGAFLEDLDDFGRESQLRQLDALRQLMDSFVDVQLHAANFTSTSRARAELCKVAAVNLETQQRIFAVLEEAGMDLPGSYVSSTRALWCELTKRPLQLELYERAAIRQVEGGKSVQAILSCATLKCARGERLTAEGQYADAARDLGTSRALLEQLPRMRRNLAMAHVLVASGECAVEQSEFQDAQRQFLQALDMLHALGRPVHPYALRALKGLARIDFTQGRSDDALLREAEARKIRTKLANKQGSC